VWYDDKRITVIKQGKGFRPYFLDKQTIIYNLLFNGDPSFSRPLFLHAGVEDEGERTIFFRVSSMKSLDHISGIIVFVLGSAVFLNSLTYPIGTLRKPGGGLFPLIASILVMGLSVLMTVQGFRTRERGKAARVSFFSEKEAPRRIILGFAALLAYRYLLPIIGFAPSSCFFIFLLSKFLGNYGWKVSLVFSFVTAIGAYYLFQLWLRIPMPSTLLGI
jgi:hypothetical protein